MPEVRDSRIPPGSFDQPPYAYGPEPENAAYPIYPINRPESRSSGSNWGWITGCVFLVAFVVVGILLFPRVLDRLQTPGARGGTGYATPQEMLDTGMEVAAPASQSGTTSTAAESPIIYNVPSTPPATTYPPAPVVEETAATYPVTPLTPQRTPLYPHPDSYTPDAPEIPASCPVAVPPPPIPQQYNPNPVSAPFPCEPAVPPPPVPQPEWGTPVSVEVPVCCPVSAPPLPPRPSADAIDSPFPPPP